MNKKEFTLLLITLGFTEVIDDKADEIWTHNSNHKIELRPYHGATMYKYFYTFPNMMVIEYSSFDEIIEAIGDIFS